METFNNVSVTVSRGFVGIHTDNTTVKAALFIINRIGMEMSMEAEEGAIVARITAITIRMGMEAKIKTTKSMGMYTDTFKTMVTGI